MVSANQILVTLAMAMSADAFRFRFYSNGGCDHGSPSGATWPANDRDPVTGDFGVCYSAPTGVDWNRLEIDAPSNRAVITHCNVGCGGGSTPQQRGGNCFVPPSGCAIGSFYLI